MSKEKTHRAAVLLAESVERLLNSETYQNALRFRTTFQTRYSFRNLWLIFIQKPDATVVAGYKKWQEVGRQVKK